MYIHKYYRLDSGTVVHEDEFNIEDQIQINTTYEVDADIAPDDGTIEDTINEYFHHVIEKPDWIVGEK